MAVKGGGSEAAWVGAGSAHWPVSTRPPTSAQVFQHNNAAELSLAQAQVHLVFTKCKRASALVYPVNILSQVNIAAQKM